MMLAYLNLFLVSTIVLATIEYAYLQNITHLPKWVANYPFSFEYRNVSLGKLIKAPDEMIKAFEQYVDATILSVDGFTDGENVDSLEHFFWGVTNGVALELGSLDGSPKTRSMTYHYENFGWKRILIDGNPAYRDTMKKNSPEAFGAIAAICDTYTIVHFAPSEYVGGILEYMSMQFMKDYHKKIYEAGIPPGNLSSIDWTKYPNVFEVDCMPLSHILHRAKTSHINFFILDVEGGELEILKSIHWNRTTFDLLCIETEPNNRPADYANEVTSFLAERGYVNYTAQIGRNIWYTRKDFIPYKRPGISPTCFNGYEKSAHAERWWANRRTPPYQRCKMDYPT